MTPSSLDAVPTQDGTSTALESVQNDVLSTMNSSGMYLVDNEKKLRVIFFGGELSAEREEGVCGRGV